LLFSDDAVRDPDLERADACVQPDVAVGHDSRLLPICITAPWCPCGRTRCTARRSRLRLGPGEHEDRCHRGNSRECACERRSRLTPSSLRALHAGHRIRTLRSRSAQVAVYASNHPDRVIPQILRQDIALNQRPSDVLGTIALLINGITGQAERNLEAPPRPASPA
jgi:hypothetical protein